MSSNNSVHSPPATAWMERVRSEDLVSWTGAEHLARYLFAAHWAPGQRVADLCCGAGYGANILTAAGAAKVCGLDVCAAVVEEANRRYGGPQIEFRCSDVSAPLTIPEVDMAVCFEGIEHLESPVELLRNIVRALTAEGVAFISTPNGAEHPGGHSGNPFHHREYTLEEFKSLLCHFFGDVRFFFQWPYRDPYDFPGRLLNWVKALVPVWLKHLARTRVRRSTGSAEGACEGGTRGFGMRPRPFPLTYLSLPGLRFAPPRYWLAVCQQPKKG